MSWEARLFVEADVSEVLTTLKSVFRKAADDAFVQPNAALCETRTDVYVVVADPRFGLKFRDGKQLELKRRIDCFFDERIDADAEQGQLTVEKWEKQRLTGVVASPELDHAARVALADAIAKQLGTGAQQLLDALRKEDGAMAITVHKTRWTVRVSNKATMEVAELTLAFGDGRPSRRVVSLCIEGIKKRKQSKKIMKAFRALVDAGAQPFVGGYPAYLQQTVARA